MIKFNEKYPFQKVKERIVQDLRNLFCCEVNLNLSLTTTEKKKLKWWEKKLIASRRGNIANKLFN